LKEIFLIRHAQAMSDDMDLKDIDRPLTADGEIGASKIGKWLQTEKLMPDLVVSSIAIRTRQTTERIIEQLNYNPSAVIYSEDLYEASTRILLRVINQIDESKNKIIMVAHNPAITYTAEYITGSVIGGVAPAGVVHIRFDGKWEEVSKGNTKLAKYHHGANIP